MDPNGARSRPLSGNILTDCVSHRKTDAFNTTLNMGGGGDFFNDKIIHSNGKGGGGQMKADAEGALSQGSKIFVERG